MRTSLSSLLRRLTWEMEVITTQLVKVVFLVMKMIEAKVMSCQWSAQSIILIANKFSIKDFMTRNLANLETHIWPKQLLVKIELHFLTWVYQAELLRKTILEIHISRKLNPNWHWKNHSAMMLLDWLDKILIRKKESVMHLYFGLRELISMLQVWISSLQESLKWQYILVSHFISRWFVVSIHKTKMILHTKMLWLQRWVFLDLWFSQ